MRPFDPKRPLHVVMRSSRAKGNWSMLSPKHAKKVDQTIQKAAKRHGIKLYRFVNVGNHLHLLIQTKRRENLRAFMREVSGGIAFLISGSKKTNPLKGEFWDKLPYSRIISWGRDLKSVIRYFIANLFEAHGAWNRKRDPHLKLILISLKEAGVGPPG